jgi:RNA polymerase sigma factor (sigma-70 family)
MDWTINKEAFDKLLLCLDVDRQEAGEKYEQIRTKLIKFFEWKGSLVPEDLADDTLNRVAKRIEEGEVIQNLNAYIYSVAQNVLKEAWRAKAAHESVDNLLPQQIPIQSTSEEIDEEREERELRLNCIESCMESLSAENRDLIINYYKDQGGVKIDNRKELAKSLGITLVALRIRVHKIKAKIEDCFYRCLKRKIEKGK